MRCDEIRERLEDAAARELPTTVAEHLEKCPACAEYARDWRLVRAGFHALAAQAVPEALPGFTARLTRRLKEVAESGAATDFFERVGRRVVLATLLLTLTVLLGLALPSGGPLGGPAATDPYLAAPAENDPVFDSDFQDHPESSPAKASGQRGETDK